MPCVIVIAWDYLKLQSHWYMVTRRRVPLVTLCCPLAYIWGNSMSVCIGKSTIRLRCIMNECSVPCISKAYFVCYVCFTLPWRPSFADWMWWELEIHVLSFHSLKDFKTGLRAGYISLMQFMVTSLPPSSIQFWIKSFKSRRWKIGCVWCITWLSISSTCSYHSTFYSYTCCLCFWLSESSGSRRGVLRTRNENAMFSLIVWLWSPLVFPCSSAVFASGSLSCLSLAIFCHHYVLCRSC